MTVTTLKAVLQSDLLAARRGRRPAEVAAIRSLLGALANAEAVPVPAGPYRVVPGRADVPRRVLDEAEVAAVVARELEERREAIEAYAAAGRDASMLRAELAVLERYLLPR
jgi:uncharacterized protein YqeY